MSTVESLWNLKPTLSWEQICSVCAFFCSITSSRVFVKRAGGRALTSDSNVLRLGRNLMDKTSKCDCWFRVSPSRTLNLKHFQSNNFRRHILKYESQALLNISDFLPKLLISYHCNVLWVWNVSHLKLYYLICYLWTE